MKLRFAQVPLQLPRRWWLALVRGDKLDTCDWLCSSGFASKPVTQVLVDQPANKDHRLKNRCEVGFVQFMGRRAAEELTPAPNTAMISISDGQGWGGAQLNHELFTRTLTAHFVDSTYSESTIEAFGRAFPVKFSAFFNRDRSIQIREFVQSCVDEGVDGFYVHCDAGRSRSAAVATWIGEAYQYRVVGDASRANELVLALLRDPSLFEPAIEQHCTTVESTPKRSGVSMITRLIDFFR